MNCDVLDEILGWDVDIRWDKNMTLNCDTSCDNARLIIFDDEVICVLVKPNFLKA